MNSRNFTPRGNARIRNFCNGNGKHRITGKRNGHNLREPASHRGVTEGDLSASTTTFSSIFKVKAVLPEGKKVLCSSFN